MLLRGSWVQESGKAKGHCEARKYRAKHEGEASDRKQTAESVKRMSAGRATSTSGTRIAPPEQLSGYRCATAWTWTGGEMRIDEVFRRHHFSGRIEGSNILFSR